MFEIGSVIAGKYRIDRDLGKGGMGKVVAATHLQLGTQVALKYLNAKMMDDATMLARFLREARAAAQLRSEHICRVLDVGSEQNVPYIVMELLEGSDLGKLVKAEPLDIATAVDYVCQACLGLAEAHAQQIVHRDLKPGNLFLTRRADGAPLIKVFDFGVAKAPHSGEGLTSSVHMVGSPAYMSPEQIVSSRDVDARSDVWSLGVILFKLVSGRLPFDAINVAQLAMQIVDSPTPPLAGVPPAFAEVVARCLEKDPADRYATVGELSLALRPFGTDVRDTNIFQATPEPGTMTVPRARPELTDAAITQVSSLATTAERTAVTAPARRAPGLAFEPTELATPPVTELTTTLTTADLLSVEAPALARPARRMSTAAPPIEAIATAPVRAESTLSTTSPRPRRTLVIGGLAALTAIVVSALITHSVMQSSASATVAPPAPTIDAAPAPTTEAALTPVPVTPAPAPATPAPATPEPAPAAAHAVAEPAAPPPAAPTRKPTTAPARPAHRPTAGSKPPKDPKPVTSPPEDVGKSRI